MGIDIGLHVGDIRHQHLLFRYRNRICRTKSPHSDIGRANIDISFHSDIGINKYRIFRYLKLINNSQMARIKISSNNNCTSLLSNFYSSCQVLGVLPLCYAGLQIVMSEMGYWTKVYSDIHYNVGLCALQSDIRRFDVRLSPISLITDIGLSAHLS